MSLQATISPSLLKVSALACVRGNSMVFADMSFQLANGEALIVRGPNGVGKSSLLRILAGLLRPAAGSVDLCGVALAEDAVAYRRNLAWLGHLDAVKSLETVGQSVRFAAALHGGHDIAPALAAMGLETIADTRIRFLSAGQKRRLALAGLIASGTKLWLADEPTTGLDAEYTGRFHAALTDHLAAGGMAVISTHEAFPLAKHCSELVMGAA